MSKHVFAKLVQPMPAVEPGGGPPSAILVPGTSVKKISIENGRFSFLAFTAEDRWQRWETDEDLPAFTDKGQASRDRRAALGPGRPQKGLKPGGLSHKNITVRVRKDQHDAIAEKAGHGKISDYVRALLVRDGMPE